MTNLTQAFSKGKAFIPFITCGDPTLATTKDLILAMAEAGADIIELGIPFSDPTAEGPTIQAANLRALSKGVTTDDIFAMLDELKETVSVPLVIMTYANVVFSYGSERFLARAKAVGIQGLILPDVPYEEQGEFKAVCQAHAITLISMIAPTSEDRIAMIAKEAEGFLYIVSSTGVTGTRQEIRTDLQGLVQAVRAVTNVPCAIGFGISSPEQAAQIAPLADGVICGSAIVNLIGAHGEEAVEPVRSFVAQMKAAVEQS